MFSKSSINLLTKAYIRLALLKIFSKLSLNLRTKAYLRLALLKSNNVSKVLTEKLSLHKCTMQAMHTNGIMSPHPNAPKKVKNRQVGMVEKDKIMQNEI